MRCLCSTRRSVEVSWRSVGLVRVFQERDGPVLMSVDVQQPHHQEHDQEPPQHPLGDPVPAFQFDPGMRQQVQQGHAQHQPAHEAHHILHPPMGEGHPARQPTPQQRSREDADAIDCQENKSCHLPILGCPPALA